MIPFSLKARKGPPLPQNIPSKICSTTEGLGGGGTTPERRGASIRGRYPCGTRLSRFGGTRLTPCADAGARCTHLPPREPRRGTSSESQSDHRYHQGVGEEVRRGGSITRGGGLPDKKVNVLCCLRRNSSYTHEVFYYARLLTPRAVNDRESSKANLESNDNGSTSVGNAAGDGLSLGFSSQVKKRPAWQSPTSIENEIRQFVVHENSYITFQLK